MNLLCTVVVGKTEPVDLLFVHVGKCGGTFIRSWLYKQRVPFTEAHMWRPSVDDRQYSRYVVWVRDPVERFRSAYDYARAVIVTNTTGWTEENFEEMCPRISTKCLAPGRLLRKVRSGHTYTEEYERSILQFKDANEVAEALSACSSASAAERKKCQLALHLMHSPIEHINKGVGWYLHDGAFIQPHADRIFVGTLENVEEDLARLSHWLNISAVPAPPPTRVSPPSNGHMSDIAQANIRAYYSRTGPTFTLGGKDLSAYVSADYEAMRGLVRAGLLRADQYDLLG